MQSMIIMCFLILLSGMNFSIAKPPKFSDRLHNNLFGSNVVSIVKSTEGHLLASVDFKGIYKSKDSGKTWQKVFDLNKPNYFYGWQLLTLQNGNILLSTYKGLYKSIDHGATWTESMQGVPKGFWIWSWYLKQDSKGAIYFNADFSAKKDNAGYNFKTFRSLDNGRSWEQLSINKQKNVAMFSMAISSQDEIVGNSWWQVDGEWHAGLVSSTDQGESWSINEFNTPSGSYIWELAFNQNDSLIANVVADGEEGGIYSASSIASSWTQMTQGLPKMMGLRNLSAASNGDLFAGIYSKENGYRGLGLYQSKDNGQSWKQLTKSIASDLYITSVYADDEHGILIGTHDKSGYYNIYQSQDNGKTWKMIMDVMNLK